MTSLRGNELAQNAFLAAVESGVLHHAWLFAGPQGVGKASFARAAAAYLLARATGGHPADLPISPESTTARLIAAGSHPDYRELARLPKDPDKPDQDLARSIKIEQVRGLQAMFATPPSMGPRRVIVIDAIDDLERPAANALLKNLEEPPAGTIFLLVSHAPGRLLPTIRSRCRLLRFETLGDDAMAAIIREEIPEASVEEVAALVRAGQGSPGRALGFAGLDIAAMDTTLEKIAGAGDPDNRERSKLAKQLGGKAAQPRYEAFLERAPTFVASTARTRGGAALRTALDAHDAARNLASAARGLSLDAEGTVFEMAGIVARLAPRNP
jgi:DNA polymerase-3 subunit delta'